MPPLAQRLQNYGADSGKPLAAPTPPKVATASTTTKQTNVNPFLRCPLPPVWSASPDSLRQFEQGGLVPQQRVFTPK